MAFKEISIAITICPTEQKHAEGLQRLYACPSVHSQTLHLPNQSLDHWQKLLGNIPSHVHSFVAVLDNQVVGNIALSLETNERRRHVGNFVIVVADGHQGQGIGKKLMQMMIDLADNWLNLYRLELTVYTDNDKAIKLYQKFGFNIEGEAVNFAFRNGQFVNAYYMARIKE